MGVHPTLLHFFLQASLVVKMVMLLLFIASLISWMLIFQRSRYLKEAKRLFYAFEQQFWSGMDLPRYYQQLKMQRTDPEGINKVFFSGYQAFLNLRAHPSLDPEAAFQMMMRAMRVATTRVASKLEAQLPLLATIGSVSPYVGLFGTVWGIMTSFQALGNVQQASIAMVAPGISEALIATAMGLFAAIPAVIAYNRFTAEIENLMTQYETFQNEFTFLLQQKAVREPVGSEDA